MSVGPDRACGPWAAPGFEGVARAFGSQLSRRLHYGSQLCVRLNGETVVDLWGGYRDSAGRGPVGPATPFMTYSATKAFTAACIHKLADEGKIGLDDPASSVWPGFGRRGKECITIRQLLTHQAGIPGRASPTEILSWPWPRLAAWRASLLRPIHPAGEKTVYHAFTAGFVLGEIIRRASGRCAADYLKEAFLGPLGMDHSHAGLPRREYRQASRIYSGDPRQAMAAAVFSNPTYRSIYLPAASLNSCARDLAVFYSMLCAGGLLGGTRYLSPRAVADATAPRYDGPDGDSGLRVRWASGFGLGGYSPFLGKGIRHMGRGGSEKTFGHSGQGGCAFGWADPPSGLVFAFTCNRFLELEAAHLRFQELADECWDALGR